MIDTDQTGFQSINPLLEKAIEKVEAIANKGGIAENGIESGFHDLDRMTTGFQPSDLIVIASRPSMGKTSLAMNIAEHVAINQKKSVAIFNLEGSGGALARNLIASASRVDAFKILTGRLDSHDWTKINLALSKLHDAPIFVDETPALPINAICSRARQLHRKQNGLGLIIIDHLQHITAAPESRIDNQTNEVAEIPRLLKVLAKELHVPVIVLSHLNRSAENRSPRMSDLRYSGGYWGGVEQYADLILFLYRDEVYNPESPDKGIAKIIIAKQRNGPIGTISLIFHREYLRFENIPMGEF